MKSRHRKRELRHLRRFYLCLYYRGPSPNDPIYKEKNEAKRQEALSLFKGAVLIRIKEINILLNSFKGKNKRK